MIWHAQYVRLEYAKTYFPILTRWLTRSEVEICEAIDSKMSNVALRRSARMTEKQKQRSGVMGLIRVPFILNFIICGEISYHCMKAPNLKSCATLLLQGRTIYDDDSTLPNLGSHAS